MADRRRSSPRRDCQMGDPQEARPARAAIARQAVLVLVPPLVLRGLLPGVAAVAALLALVGLASGRVRPRAAQVASTAARRVPPRVAGHAVRVVRVRGLSRVARRAHTARARFVAGIAGHAVRVVRVRLLARETINARLALARDLAVRTVLSVRERVRLSRRILSRGTV